jgi:hypothetical protein
MRHFHEKVAEKHGIKLSYTFVQKALQGAGLVGRGRQRRKHRRRRERRPMPGMLLHIDGSKHHWLQDERWHDLIVIREDATSEIYYAQLVEEESTRTVMAGLREVIQRKGLFCALYSDRGSHFFVTPKGGEKVDKHRLTQVGRALKELGVQMIPAYSPQAHGRSERSFGTWQGRLPQELRLAGITTVEAVHRPSPGTGHGVSQNARADLNWIFYRANRARGGQGQHGGHGRSTLAVGKEPLPEFFGGLYGNHPSTLGRRRVDPLRPARGRPFPSHPARTFAGEPWKRRARGNRRKPKAGFPPFPPPLGNSQGFPLSHRSYDSFFSFQNKPKKTPVGQPTRGSWSAWLNRTDHV